MVCTQQDPSFAYYCVAVLILMIVVRRHKIKLSKYHILSFWNGWNDVTDRAKFNKERELQFRADKLRDEKKC